MTTLEIILTIFAVIQLAAIVYLFALLQKAKFYLRRAVAIAEKAAHDFNTYSELAKKLAIGGAILLAFLALKRMSANDDESAD